MKIFIMTDNKAYLTYSVHILTLVIQYQILFPCNQHNPDIDYNISFLTMPVINKYCFYDNSIFAQHFRRISGTRL